MRTLQQIVSGRVFRATAVMAALFASIMPTAKAEDNVGGHIGFVLPMVTREAGVTTNNLADNFAIGFPMGITVKGHGRMAFDMELVPMIHTGASHDNSLTIHPGLVWNVGHHVGVGMRAAFDVNSSTYGFTPLVNKSWPIKSEGSFFKAYFVEAVLPVRFNRPVVGPQTTPVTFAMHFGLGF